MKGTAGSTAGGGPGDPGSSGEVVDDGASGAASLAPHSPLHHPARLDGSTTLQRDGAVALPQSYELDAAPAFERFVLVSADDPNAAIDPTQVMAAARALAALPTAASDPLALPAGWRQSSFLVRKVAP